MDVTSRAWMLEPIEFHHDFEALLAQPDGLVEIRDRAVALWNSTDDIVRSYVELLAVDPDGWHCECEDTHLVEWYRMLMAPYLLPMSSLPRPDLVRQCLPALGWHAAEARRLARGRELVTLAERHLDDPTVERLRLRFGWNHKGWLDHDDLVDTLDRLCGLGRRDFRGHRELVPVVDGVFQVFEQAATKPDHVLLVLSTS
jgi:hypothetical protein